jgi:hypothetical protein
MLRSVSNCQSQSTFHIGPDCIESNDRSVVELFDIIFTEDVERQVPSAEEEEETDIVELLQGEGPINRYQRVCMLHFCPKHPLL